MRSTRVVIADRYPVILQGLSRVLEAQPDFKIVAHCADGASCIKAIRKFSPEIAVLDVSLPDISGLEILAITSSEGLPTRIVFFTEFEERDLGLSGAAGVHVVIRKDVDSHTLVQSLRQVAHGQKVSRLPSYDQTESPEQGGNTEKAATALTDRERQIMRLVCEGLSNKEIGRRLNITDGTIKVHLHNIFQKLEIGNRTALAALAISQNEHANLSPGNHGGPWDQRKGQPDHE
jgi:two-component system, NarL family, nitrate/nitrite response regulator NarL